MSSRFCADYAKRAANCKKCKQQLTKGILRIAKIVPNPFGRDGGDMKQYYHPKCLFESFEKARATTAVIESSADIEQWADIEETDKEVLVKLIKDLVKKRENKMGKNKASPASKPAATNSGAASNAQRKIDDVFGQNSSRGSEDESEEPKAKNSKDGDSKAEMDDLDLFTGVKAFLMQDVKDREKMIRYINFYDGEVLGEYSVADATVIISDSLDKVNDVPKTAVQIHSKWIWETVKKQKRQPMREFKV